MKSNTEVLMGALPLCSGDEAISIGQERLSEEMNKIKKEYDENTKKILNDWNNSFNPKNEEKLK